MGNKCFKNEEKNILTNFEDEDQYETLKENLIEDLFEGDNIFLEKYKDEYKIINIIQKDFIYNIYKAQNINEKREVCLKVYNKNKLELGDYDFFLEKIKREEEIVKLCNSKNIVNIYKKIETPYNIIFEMESWDINLSDYIEKNGEFPYNETFREILYGITDALKILHKNNIIHRNIRPCNLFLTGKNLIKLGGFEHSIYIKDNTSEPIGCYYYAAPEIIKKLPYNEKCDLWSLGITLHELLFGNLPYGINPSKYLVKQAILYQENFCYKKSDNKLINGLFSQLLNVNQKNRINFEDFFDYIEKFRIEAEKEKDIIFPIKTNIDKKKGSFKNVPKNNYVIKDKYMKKIMNIIEADNLPDIMNFPNGCVNSKENISIKFNNIIYYDENKDFNNFVKKDSDVFEKITSGAFILCENLESMSIIREEILKKNKNDKRIVFNLITSGRSCEKIMDFINSNKEFDNCIKNICIFCVFPKKYIHLKNKYPKIHDDIYHLRKDVIEFINKHSSENIKAFPITKLITLDEYKSKYKDRHIKISEYYGNINLNIYKKFYMDIKDLIDEESRNKKLKTTPKDLIEGFSTFNIENAFKNKKVENYSDIELLDRLIIKEYSKSTFFKDLNKWLMNPKISTYEVVSYFTARLMYSLNSYAIKNSKYFTLEETLYRGIKMPYSNLLPYERAKGKIIILTSFTSTSQKEAKAKSFSGRCASSSIYITNLLFSVIFIIKNIYKNNWISNGINIQELSMYPGEKEILFQPFSFYYVIDVKIDLKNYTADIYLETIGKTKILEEELKNGKEIRYNKTDNIIEIEES